jgi:DNA-binding FrmR family transcriptional regulator
MDYEQDVKNRLKRIEGQIRGVLRMIDEEKDVKSVISQLSAARTALGRSIAFIAVQNLQQSLEIQYEKGEEASDAVKEAVQLLVKSK